MAESKHTPGPWEWYWRQEDGKADCGIFWQKFAGHAYSIARCPQYQTKKQWEADARLISAAPEMLPIVELIAGIELPPAAEGWPDDRSLIGYRETVITVGHVRAARAAISKATGSA